MPEKRNRGLAFFLLKTFFYKILLDKSSVLSMLGL
ncbi:hypothetical protein G5S_0178 [Chlamydia pecorum E58]|uniref:Uncharacterized protein n=1 Tax=Chlamydia pecorum (strain ATCC VR-628 / DSM 29919 / E58) TaxID=331635 RepID=A0AA34RCI7_CHLPE|nr:hypothetical protein G5S_0178 [Chlamydia pecorum E58]